MKKISQLDGLFTNGRRIELSKDEVLHDSHEKCSSLGLLINGKLRFSRILNSGREIIVKEFLPGEIYGELLVFTGELFPGWLIASQESTVIEVDLDSVLKYLREEKRMMSFIGNIAEKTNHLAN